VKSKNTNFFLAIAKQNSSGGFDFAQPPSGAVRYGGFESLSRRREPQPPKRASATGEMEISATEKKLNAA